MEVIALQQALGPPSLQLSDTMGALLLSAKAVMVHWLYREPTVKKSDWKVVALALTMIKPEAPAGHVQAFSLRDACRGVNTLHWGKRGVMI